jgi:DNA-binding transcriptional ArsR family regulator
MSVLQAIADPTRREIVELLSLGELSVGEIVGRFDVTGPAISQHLKVLRGARLVRAKVQGQRRIYALDRTGFAELDAWLSRFREAPPALAAAPYRPSQDLLQGMLGRPA